MILEAINKIQELAIQSSFPKPAPIESDKKFFYFNVDGTVSNVDIPPESREHYVNRLSDIVALSVELGSDEAIFHDTNRLTYFPNFGDRRDSVVMNLNWTDEFNLLKTWCKRHALEHRELLRVLKVTLRRCVNDDIVSRIRGINFDQQAQGESYIAPGAEKIGKSVTQKVVLSGSSEIPEELRLSVPMCDNEGLDFHVPMIVSLEIDLNNRNFIVQTLPGEIEAAQRTVAARIDEYLTGELSDVTIVRGTP